MQDLNRESIFDWIENLNNVLTRSAWASTLTYQDIYLGNVLETRIYAWFLRYARGGTHAANSSLAWNDRINLLKQQAAERWQSWWMSTPPTHTSFLFWPREFTHVQQQIPVAQALRAAGYQVQFIACQQRIWHELWRNGEKAGYTGKAWSPALQSAHQNGLTAIQQLQKPVGIPLPAPNEKISPAQVETELRQLLSLLIPDIYQYICNAQQALEKYTPEALIVGNDLSLEGRTACIIAREKTIPTIAIMHGSVSGEPMHRLHIADRFLVYGEDSRRELLQHGLNEKQVVACGAPYLDQRAIQSGKTHPALQKYLGLRPVQRWILLAASGVGLNTSLKHHLLLLEAVARLSKANPAVRFISKLHRTRDKLEYYTEIAQKIPGSRLEPIVYNTPGIPNDIYDWLQGCSMVITGASSVANEALLMDVPVITVDLLGEFLKVNFIQEGATHHVTNETDLHKIASQLLENPVTQNMRPQAKAYLEKYFGPLDRQSSRRCADEIVSLAATKRYLP